MLPYQNEDVLEVGIDEAGRGCLLGRVYVAGVILPNNIIELCEEENIIIKDSKKMSKKNKEKSREFIERVAIDYSIVYKENDYIDKYNIFESTHKSMHEVVANLSIQPEKILVDGNYFRTYWSSNGEEVEHECIIGGDNIYMSIAAASILAKTYKDKYIEELVEQHPQLKDYDLLNNSGYGTANHLEAIKLFGTTPFHRKTFGLCKNY
jgi:ribonuclease HII